MKKIIVLSLLLSLFSFVASQTMHKDKSNSRFNQKKCKRNPLGETLLHRAIINHNHDEIEKHKDLIFETDSNGNSVLHYVMLFGPTCDEKQKLTIIDKLFCIISERYSSQAEDAKIEFINKQNTTNGETALHRSISRGYVAIAIYLIKAGADITIIDSFDRTTLHTALLTRRIKKYEDRKNLVKQLCKDILNKEKYFENYEKTKSSFLNQLGNNERDEEISAFQLAISYGYIDIAIDILEIIGENTLNSLTTATKEDLDVTKIYNEKNLWNFIFKSTLKISDKRELIKSMIFDLKNNIIKYKELYPQDYKTKISNTLELLDKSNLELLDLRERVRFLRKEKEEEQNLKVLLPNIAIITQKIFMLL